MYLETFKGLFADEVAEEMSNIAKNFVIDFNGLSFRIPHEIRSGSAQDVKEWREKIRSGIRGDFDVITSNGYTCGTIPAWTLHNILAHETFYIRSATADKNAVIIHNADELATYLDTTPDKIPEDIRTYTDYETVTTVTAESLTLRTIAGDTGKQTDRMLYFPFSDEAYENAIVGLQCWADATYWETQHNEEDE